jgi:hypothetical protein
VTPHDHIRRLLAILTRIGGYLTPEDQNAIAASRAEVGDVPTVKEWRDRGEGSGER